MKNLFILTAFIVFLTSCNNSNSEQKSNQEEEKSVETKETTQKTDSLQTAQQDTAYALVQQNCYVCHFEKPNPDKRDQMIAPPMSNVQQHYKSTYTDREDFIKAVVSWANHPSEENSMMPGSVRRFGLMPPLPIGDDKLSQIAGALYDHDFGNFRQGKGMMRHSLSETQGKTKLNPEDIKKVHAVIDKLNNKKPETLDDYHALGKEIFDDAKNILLNKNYNDETLQQVQAFFHNIEDDMHNLMAVETVEDGENYVKLLQKKFSKFDQYFE